MASLLVLVVLNNMKALPLPDIFKTNQKLYFDCMSETLDMVTSPSRAKGIEVILTRNCDCWKAGMKGVVRQFNAVDLEKVIREYNSTISYGTKHHSWPLVSLNNVYDFFPIITRKGKTEVSTWHAHISRFDFRILKPKQLLLEL